MSTTLRRYYRGHSLVAMRDVQAGANRYYHFDHQGTTQCLTDASGAVTDRFAADAWGVEVKRTGSSINRHWYIGNLGYYRGPDARRDHTRLRSLAVDIGRWLARKSLSADREPEAPNGYSFQGNRASSGARVVLAAAKSNLRLVIEAAGLQPVGMFGTGEAGQFVGECGRISWFIRWVLCDGRLEGKASRVGGFVIQHINRPQFDVKDCNNNKVKGVNEAKWDGKLPYWELWPMVPRRSRTLVKTPPYYYHDDEYSLAAEGDCTKGSITLKGEAWYYDALTPQMLPPKPNPFDPNMPGPDPYFFPDNPLTTAGSLPATVNDPEPYLNMRPGVSVTPKIPHNLIVEWDCCPDSKKRRTKFTCTPSACIQPVPEDLYKRTCR